MHYCDNVWMRTWDLMFIWFSTSNCGSCQGLMCYNLVAWILWRCGCHDWQWSEKCLLEKKEVIASDTRPTCHDRSLSRRFVRSDRSPLGEGRLKVVIAWFCIQVVIKDSKDHLLNQVTIWELWDCNSYPPPPPQKKKIMWEMKKVCGIICGSWFYIFNERCGNKKKSYLKDTAAMRLLVYVWVFDQGGVQKWWVHTA